MYRTLAILILSSLVIFKTVRAQESTTILSADATDKDVELLHSINWQQALPLIIFETDDHLFFRYPDGLKKAEIKDGRLVKGTEFIKPERDSGLYRPTSNLPEIFLCPDPNTNETCLLPTHFEESEILQCQREPIPILDERPGKITCGLSGNGIIMEFVYKICSIPSIKFVTKSIVTYSLCYDDIEKRILFVDYRLSSVNLFYEKLLTREREITSELSKEIYNLIDSKYYEILDSAAETKSKYKFQKLVPIDNLALAAWRKTSYKYVNLALQHEALFDLWNNINDLIRTNAKYSQAESSRRIMTGVFDIPKDRLPKNIDEDQIYNIWATAIVNSNGNPLHGKIKIYPVYGIAILMNNFIAKDDKDDKDDTEDTASSQQQYIDEICGENLCVRTLMKEFAAVKGEVRCCNLTEKIKEFFWRREGTSPQYNYETLFIRDLTITRLPV